MAENKIDTYYFLGIGGIGMSALARYFASEGCRVLGYDRVCTPLTTELEAEGIAVQYDDRLDWVEGLDVEKTLVVRTPAVPEDAAVYVWLREHGFHIVKRAELLGEVTRQKKALCVAGTHGKTTTSTILAHILYGSHAGANAFLGGIANNYGTNLLLNKESDVVVVEADEFDRSFHHLTPYMSVITSMDPDHLDIYGTEAAYRASFEQYAGLVEHALVVKSSLRLNVETLKARVYTYSVGEKADFYADNVRVKDGEIWFDFYTPESKVADIQLGVPVLVNVENSVAAMALAVLMGATEEELRDGMRSFMGVYRRFNVHVNTPRVTYIDDYAHHPQELKATIDSVRYLYPERYVIGVFQPHLYSRTRDFADGFAEVLSGLDEVALLPIYPAREEPIEGVTSEWLMEKIGTKRALVLPNILAKYLRERVKQCMAQGKDCVVVTMGAGDISDQVNDIEKALQI
jgi:UDP-N-acetylmuramate--alanine ligase